MLFILGFICGFLVLIPLIIFLYKNNNVLTRKLNNADKQQEQSRFLMSGHIGDGCN